MGPVLALAPVFSIVPDWWLTGTLPRGLGWIGVGLAVVGTAGLSATPKRRLDLRGLFTRADALDALGSAFFLGVLAAVDRHNVLAMACRPTWWARTGCSRSPAGGGPGAHAEVLAASLRAAQLPRVLLHSVSC